jgi:hypothetical protein
MHKQSVSAIMRKAINSKHDFIKDTKRTIVRLRQVKGTVEDLVRKVLPMLHGMDVRMDMFCYYHSPTLRITVSGVPGFKDNRLASVLSMLMDQGFTESRTFESAEYLNREYSFTRGDLDVEVNVYVASDSPTCRRIPVGEKTITQVQYEIQCD